MNQSTAITEQEYLEFFDENITVKRRRELKEKIGRRIDSLDWNLFNISGHDFDLEDLERQSPNDAFDCDDSFIYFEVNTEMSSVEKDLEVKFLWDDEYLESVTKEIEEHNKEEIEALRKYDLAIEKAFLALSSLSKNHQALFLDQDCNFFLKVSQKLKDAQEK